MVNYQEQLALEKERLFNASAAAGSIFNTSISGWGSATDLDTTTPANTFEDPCNYSSPNGTGMDDDDTALFSDIINHILFKYSSVDESTSVLDSYNNSITSREPHSPVLFSSPFRSTDGGNVSTGDVGVPALKEAIPTDILAAGTNDSDIALESLHKFHTVIASFKTAQRTDGIDEKDRPLNLTDINDLGTEPTVPSPMNFTVNAANIHDFWLFKIFFLFFLCTRWIQ